MEDWLQERTKVFVKGNLVLCENVIYSYQMKIGMRCGGVLLLVGKDQSPSVTTSKHLGLVRRAAESLHITMEPLLQN